MRRHLLALGLVAGCTSSSISEVPPCSDVAMTRDIPIGADSCLEGPFDTADEDPNNPGTQLQCIVNDLPDGSAATQTLIAVCTMTSANTPDPSGTRPCWWAYQDSAACPAPDTGYQLHVERSQPAAAGTTLDVQCLVTSPGSPECPDLSN